MGGDEWLRGRTLKGEEGIFPKAFVEIVVSNEVMGTFVHPHLLHCQLYTCKIFNGFLILIVFHAHYLKKIGID